MSRTPGGFFPRKLFNDLASAAADAHDRTLAHELLDARATDSADVMMVVLTVVGRRLARFVRRNRRYINEELESNRDPEGITRAVRLFTRDLARFTDLERRVWRLAAKIAKASTFGEAVR